MKKWKKMKRDPIKFLIIKILPMFCHEKTPYEKLENHVKKDKDT